jgi:hypothetical protein
MPGVFHDHAQWPHADSGRARSRTGQNIYNDAGYVTAIKAYEPVCADQDTGGLIIGQTNFTLPISCALT